MFTKLARNMGFLTLLPPFGAWLGGEGFTPGQYEPTLPDFLFLGQDVQLAIGCPVRQNACSAFNQPVYGGLDSPHCRP